MGGEYECLEKNVSIENYKPDFAVEAAYDLTVADLKNKVSRRSLVDLDNTLIAWNNRMGLPGDVRQWLHDLRDGGFQLSWCPIIVPNGSSVRLRNFDIDYEAWSLKPLYFWIDRALKRFHYEKNEVVMVGDQLMTDIRAAHRAGIRSILVKPWLSMTPSRPDQSGRVNAVL